MQITKSLQHRVVAFMSENKLKQYEFAEKLKVNPSWVSRFFRDKAGAIDDGTARKLEKLLHIKRVYVDASVDEETLRIIEYSPPEALYVARIAAELSEDRKEKLIRTAKDLFVDDTLEKKPEGPWK